MKFPLKNLKFASLQNFLWVALGIVLVFNIGLTFQSKSATAEKKAQADELVRPANLTLTIITDSTCANCIDLTKYIDAVKQQNVNIVKEETIDAKSDAAKKIIADMKIERIPTFIATGELTKDGKAKQILEYIGKIENDSFKFTLPIAPYVDLGTNQVKGANMNLVLLADKSCAECYDVKVHKTVLERFGITKFSSDKTLDRYDSEAQKLIKKYNIKSIPTFILTGEVSEYGELGKIWEKVGTVEGDGAYIFRELTQLGQVTYRDLQTNKIIKPAAAQ